MGLYKEAIKVHAEATLLLPQLVDAIRKELALPMDASFLLDLQKEANAQMIAVSEQFESFLKSAAEQKQQYH